VIATMGWVENLKRYGLQGTVDLSGDAPTPCALPHARCLCRYGRFARLDFNSSRTHSDTRQSPLTLPDACVHGTTRCHFRPTHSPPLPSPLVRLQASGSVLLERHSCQNS